MIWIVGFVVILALVMLIAEYVRKVGASNNLQALMMDRAGRAAYHPPAPRCDLRLDVSGGADADEMAQRPDGRPETRVPGLFVGIDYVDAGGRTSRRRVTVHAFAPPYLKTWCHERRDWRTFRLDRVQAAFDPISGEVLTDLQAALDFELTRQGATRKLLDVCLDGLTVLMFLARVDGVLHSTESQVIADYVSERARVYKGRDNLVADARQGEIVAYALRLFPTPNQFKEAVAKLTLSKSDKTNRRLIGEHALKLIEADGTVSDDESRFAEGLRDWLGKKRA